VLKNKNEDTQQRQQAERRERGRRENWREGKLSNNPWKIPAACLIKLDATLKGKGRKICCSHFIRRPIQVVVHCPSDIISPMRATYGALFAGLLPVLLIVAVLHYHGLSNVAYTVVPLTLLCMALTLSALVT
jgi:hypothetical protein